MPSRSHKYRIIAKTHFRYTYLRVLTFISENSRFSNIKNKHMEFYLAFFTPKRKCLNRTTYLLSIQRLYLFKNSNKSLNRYLGPTVEVEKCKCVKFGLSMKCVFLTRGPRARMSSRISSGVTNSSPRLQKSPTSETTLSRVYSGGGD